MNHFNEILPDLPEAVLEQLGALWNSITDSAIGEAAEVIADTIIEVWETIADATNKAAAPLP